MAIHYANPDETCFIGSTFEFQFGERTIVRVYHKPKHVEDALELAAEWLAEHALGRFVKPNADQAHFDRKCETSLCGEPGEGYCDQCLDLAHEGLTRTESGWLRNEDWMYRELDGDPLSDPHFDRFDIVEAWYCYWNAHHCGQFSDGYRALCRVLKLGKPSDAASSFEALSDNGKAIYRRICLRDGR